MEFYQVCCLDAQLCDMFHERRPSDTCLATPIATSSQVSRRKRFIFFVVVFIYVPPFWSKCLKCILSQSPSSFHFKGWFWGDPHINTLDGRMYTFNGRGEYTLVSLEGFFELQARTQPVSMNTSATQFTACAMAASREGTRIEVSI